MLVIVHTLTMTLGDLEVNALFYHRLLQQSSRSLKLSLIGKEFAVKRLNKGLCSFKQSWNKKPHYKHHLRAICFKPKNTVLKSKFRQMQTVTSTSSAAKEEQPSQQEVNTPPSSPNQKPTELNSNGLVGVAQSEIGSVVSASWSPQQASVWLQGNRYGPHLHTLSSYSGADLLRLSKDNLIQLCGLPDGIRLFNALHAKCVIPKVTLYICVEPRERVYQVLYLTSLTRTELLNKVCQTLGLEIVQVSSVYMFGPNSIKLLLTDQVVAHIPDHSVYTISVAHDGSDRYRLMLKLSDNTAPI